MEPQITASESWPCIVGYQHEVLHTGVLAHVLDGPQGPTVASALIEDDVATVEWYQLESRLPRHRGIADLQADLKLVDGGSIRLGVETKVDSNATLSQLRATASGDGQRGVLLALGRTAFSLAQQDFALMGLERWQAVGPAAWAGLLRSIEADRNPTLAPYLAAVEREADAHKRARARATDAGIPQPRDEGRDGTALAHAAWMAAVRTEVTAAVPRRFRVWWTATTQGGPVLVLWSDELSEPFGGRDVFLQVSCTQKARLLGLKVGGGTGDPDAAYTRLVPVAGAAGLTVRARRKGNTFTVASTDLTEMGSGEAAAHTMAVYDDVLGGLTA